MLPVRHTALPQALIALRDAPPTDRDVRLRVGLRDGEVVDGVLESASAEHLSLRLASAQARYVPADQIRSVHLAVERPLRGLLPVAVIVLGTTAALIPIWQVEWLRSRLPEIVAGLVLLEVAGLALLQRHTALGGWLTAWRTLYEAPER